MRLVIRRVARRFLRVINAVLPLFAVPYVKRAGGIDVVDSARYGLAIGQPFSDSASASRHYFTRGWRLGVVPNGLIDYPAARFSLLASLRLRNDLARLARTGVVGAHAARPARLLNIADFRQRHPELAHSRSGLIGAVMSLPEAQRDRLVLSDRNSSTTWSRYRADAERLTAAARIVLDDELLDLGFYRSQVGGADFVSREAALDDYLANGERDGRTPHPFFDAEWYEDRERSQIRSGRPVSQFLDFVARGQVGEAGPHFWGERYALSLQASGVQPPRSLLRHFLESAPSTHPTPSSPLANPVSKKRATDEVRRRVAEYHASLGRLSASGDFARRHDELSAGSAPPARGEVAVFVDARLLTPAYADDLVVLMSRQVKRPAAIVVLASDNEAPEQFFSAEDVADLRLEFVYRSSEKSLGAAIASVLDTMAVDAWTLWAPQQEWAPDFIAELAAALDQSPGSAVAVAVAPTAPQQWLRSDDALWLPDLDDGGLLIRHGEQDGLTPADIEFGILADVALRVSGGLSACFVEAPLLEMRSDHRNESTQRAGLNSARAIRLLGASSTQTARTGTGVVIPTFEDWRMTLDAVRSVLSRSDEDVHVSIVDNGSRRPVAVLLASAFAAEPRVTIERLPRNTDFALGCNLGAELSPAETIIFLNNDTIVQDGWMRPLTEALSQRSTAAVQPLLVYGDRTVQTAGTVFAGGVSMPMHLLSGYHEIDVPDALNDYSFSALTAACLAVSYSDFVSAGRFDTRYVNGMEDIDFCLSLRRVTGGHLRVCTTSRVVHLESKTAGRGKHIESNRSRFVARWNRTLVEELDDRDVLDGTALELRGVTWQPQGRSPLRLPSFAIARRTVDQAAVVDERAPSLRWALKISSTGDVAGDTWGDEFFARDLASALSNLGQTVVIDRSTSHTRHGSDGWDDVTLTLRGLVPVLPQPGAINLLWVISHPDMITGNEMTAGFDRIYSAGEGWAAAATSRWGVRVSTLLQATNAERFSPAARTSNGHGVLFVGRTRAVARPIVRDAIEAGLDVEVYGDDGWEQFIPRRYIRGSGIPNGELPRAYASADFVLNDHWPDMARLGFYSNRLFDAAASGARIISDHVPGLHHVFGEQVKVYEGPQSLQRLTDPTLWPSRDELNRLAQRVRNAHSFEARARQLIEDVVELRRRAVR